MSSPATQSIAVAPVVVVVTPSNPQSVIAAQSIGKIAKYGRGSAITFHGLKKDIVSSGLQKAGIRRGDATAGQWYLLEWLLFGKWTAEPRRVKGLLTNLKNRLGEIAVVEDVLAFAQPALLLAVRNRVEAWESAQRAPDAGRQLLQVLQWQSVARKGRVGSDLRAYCHRAVGEFGLRARMPLPALMGLPALITPLTKKDSGTAVHLVRAFLYQARQPNTISVTSAAAATTSDDGDGGDGDGGGVAASGGQVPPALLAFDFVFQLLAEFNPMVLAKDKTLKPTTASALQHTAKHAGGTTGDYLLWEELLARFKVMKNKPLAHRAATDLHTLYRESTRKTRGERFLYLIHACLMYVYQDHPDIDFRQAALDAFLAQSPMPLNDWHALVQSHVSGPVHTPEPYVADMHTAEGRRAGKNALDFATEGSMIVGECPSFLQATMRATYLQLKTLEVTKPTKRPARSSKRSRAECDEDEDDEDDDEAEESDDVDKEKDTVYRPSTQKRAAIAVHDRPVVLAPAIAAAASASVTGSATTTAQTSGTHEVASSQKHLSLYQQAPTHVFKVPVLQCKLAQLPCGAKPPTWLVHLHGDLDELLSTGEGGGDRAGHSRYFVRPLPRPSHKQWDFHPPTVDQLKLAFGVLSAASIIDVHDQLLVARDLGTPPIGNIFYPTMINGNVEVVDKLQTGVPSLSKQLKVQPELLSSATFWASLWETLIWRATLGCSDTNLSNILWSIHTKRCVSIDELHFINPAQREKSGVAALFSQRPASELCQGLVSSFDQSAINTLISRWSTVLDQLTDSSSSEASKLHTRMRSNMEWILTRVATAWQ